MSQGSAVKYFTNLLLSSSKYSGTFHKKNFLYWSFNFCMGNHYIILNSHKHITCSLCMAKHAKAYYRLISRVFTKMYSTPNSSVLPKCILPFCILAHYGSEKHEPVDSWELDLTNFTLTPADFTHQLVASKDT